MNNFDINQEGPYLRGCARYGSVITAITADDLNNLNLTEPTLPPPPPPDKKSPNKGPLKQKI